ncbi:MAG: adenylate/guanylate cyclase domain-containing protein [Alphaproteobacteria bacterium]|nr:adenylate/guanylate cyclase domain-containing protein [Alphaproteobacteria bacterium]
MSDIVNDLYTLSRNRWTLYQQYEGKTLNRAIGDAEKLLASKKVDAVGIIREGPERRGGPAVETLAYCDTRIKNTPDLNQFPVIPLSQQEHDAQQGKYFDEQEENADDDGGDRQAHQPAAVPAQPSGSAAALPVKLFTVAFISLGVGWGLWTAISHLGGMDILIDLVGPRNTAAKTMGLGFLISLFILIPATISGRDVAAAFQSKPVGHQPQAPRPQNRRTSAANKDVEDLEQAGKDVRKEGGKKKKKKKKSETGEADTGEDQDDSTGGDKDDKEGTDAADTGIAGKLTETRAQLVKFFERCMAYVMAIDPDLKGGRLDAVTSFGCQLFFAGAAEVLIKQQRMDAGQLGKVLVPCAMALGQSKEQVAKFADKYESYLLEPGYLDMFRAGREAMTTALQDEVKAAEKAAADEAEAASSAPKKIRSPADDDFDGDWESEEDIGIFLAQALDAWRSPKDRKGNLTAVLFTDIVGSTSITQEHGDEASQVMVNIHNSIVRGALQAHGGWEVKHTGDGIMAGFSNPPAAVDAGVDMQRGVKQYNTPKPDIELRLRVGISVGEPIAEDDDLFGATVQMAARLCDGAGTDGVMITNMLKEMCQGRALEFQDVEPKMFKGIAEPVPVSLVEWRQKKKKKPA